MSQDTRITLPRTSPGGVSPDHADANRLGAFFTVLQDASRLSANEFESFFQDFEQDYRDARKNRAATTPHLDVLRVFGLEFAELRHSDVLAWFLKPTGEHEQGSLFLNALLQWLGIEPIPDENYVVLRERHYRTDVAAYASHRFAVFIENKVRHYERKLQVADMVDSLVQVSQDCGIPRKRRFAVFLTDKGDKSGTGPDSDSAEFVVDNLKSLGRVKLFELFRAALETRGQTTYSPLLMNFLNSYLNAIRRIRVQLS